MSKIEREMVQAARNRCNWKSGGTEVRCNGADGEAHVYLHGHHIATMHKDCTVAPNRDTFRAWPTTTTRSRLCALGVHASIRNFAPCIDGEEL